MGCVFVLGQTLFQTCVLCEMNMQSKNICKNIWREDHVGLLKHILGPNLTGIPGFADFSFKLLCLTEYVIR